MFRDTTPWKANCKHFIPDFEAFAVTLMRQIYVKRAIQILAKSDTRMWGMHFSRVKAVNGRLRFDNVVWVGTDEIKRRSGHNYVTKFVDFKTVRVLFANGVWSPRFVQL